MIVLSGLLQKIMCQQLGQPEEISKFSEIYNLPKQNQEKIENMNTLIGSNEIESVFKKLPTNKAPRPDGFTFKEELIPILLKLFQKLEEEIMLVYSFYDASITLIPKAKTLQKKGKL